MEKSPLSIWKSDRLLASCPLHRKHTGWKGLWEEENLLHPRTREHADPAGQTEFSQPRHSSRRDCVCCVADARSQGNVPFLRHDVKVVQTFTLHSYKRSCVIQEIILAGINTPTTTKYIREVPAQHWCWGWGRASSSGTFIHLLKITLLESSSDLSQESLREGAGVSIFQWENKQH